MAITPAMRTNVIDLYIALFGRAPEAEGLGYWVKQLDAGTTLAKVANDMFATSAARPYYPSAATNDEIIGKFYQNVLGRTADAGGLAYWTAKLNGGQTVGSVIIEMITAVKAYAGTDAAALSSQKLFLNKEAVATYYGVDLAATSVAGGTTVLAGVTSDPASVSAAKAVADGIVNPVQTFTLTPSAVSVDEGSTVFFTLDAKGTPAGSQFAYTIAGVNTADVVGGALSGTATVDSQGKAVIAVTLVNDATTEGVENLTVSVAGKTASVTVNDTSLTPAPVVPTYSLKGNTATVAEGGTIFFDLSTTNVAAGTKIGYKITGTGSASGLTGSGVAEIDASGTAVISLTAGANAVIGDTGSVKVELLNGKASVSATVTDASPTSFGPAEIAAANASGIPLTVNVTGTAPATLTFNTDQVSPTNGFVVNSTAPVTITSGAAADKITLVGNANNTITTGAGNDSVTINGSGANTINVGAGTDTVVGGSGDDTIIMGSGALDGADRIDGGTGNDTLVISGNGNVINTTNVVGVENLQFVGTAATITPAYLSAMKGTISASSATTQLTVTGGGTADFSNVTFTAGSGLKSLTVDAATTLKLSASLIAGTSSITSTAGAGTLTIDTNVAGFNALGTKATGATVTITDTLANVLAAGTSLGSSTVSIGTVTAADAKAALASAPNVKFVLQDTPANLALASQAVINNATKIVATADMTASQAAALATKIAGGGFVATATNVVYNVSDSAAALASTTSGLGNATTVTATTTATPEQAGAIKTAVDAGVVTTAANYAVAGTAAGLAAAVGTAAQLAGMNVATSVTVTDAATIAQIQTINTALNGAAGGLTKVAAGYAVTDSLANLLANQTEANAAGNLTLTDASISVTNANAVEALTNSGKNSYVLADTTSNLLAASADVLAATTSASSSSASLTVDEINGLINKFGTTKFVDSSLAVTGTVTDLLNLSSGSLAKINAAATHSLTLSGNVTVQQLMDLKAKLGTTYSGLLPTTINVVDSAANLKAAVADTTKLAALDAATSIALDTTATDVATVTAINTALNGNAGGLTAVNSGYSLNDTAAKLAAGGASGVVDNATLVTVSGTATLAQVDAIATAYATTGTSATLGTQLVYTLTDSASALTTATLTGPSTRAQVEAGATSISITDATVSAANAVLLKAITKFDGKYAISDSVTGLNTAYAGAGGPAAIAGASSVKLVDSVAALTGAGSDAARGLATTVVAKDSLANLDSATSLFKSSVSSFELTSGVDVSVSADVAKLNGLLALKSTVFTLDDGAGTATTYAALTSAANANVVAKAAAIVVDGALTVAQAANLKLLTGATLTYSLSDKAVNLANAAASIISGATTKTISAGATDANVSVAQATILKAASITGYKVVDTAAAISAATDTVLTGAATVTVNDGGLASVTIVGANAVYSNAGNTAQKYNISIDGAKLTVVGGAVVYDASGANITVTNLVKSAQGVTVTGNVTAAVADVLATLKPFGTLSYSVKDTATNLAASTGASAAVNIEASTAATWAEAQSINGKSNTGTKTFSVSDVGTTLASAITTGTATQIATAKAVLEKVPGTVTATGNVDAAGATALAALTKPVVYSISDSATNVAATTVTQAALDEAKNINVTGTANAALAAKLLAALNTGTTTIATVSVTSAEALGLTLTSNDTITTLSVTGTTTIADAVAINAKDTGPNIGTVAFATITGTAADIIANSAVAALATTTVTVTGTATVAQAVKLQAQDVAQAASYTFNIADSYVNLMAKADPASATVDAAAALAAAAKVTVTSGALTVAEAVALRATGAASYGYSIADTNANIVSAVAANSAALLGATSVAGADGQAITFQTVGGQVSIVGTPSAIAALDSAITANLNKVYVVSVADLNANPVKYSTLSATEKIRVCDTIANLTSGNALVATATSIEVTDPITKAQAAVVNAWSAAAADQKYALADTAANLASLGSAGLNKATSATATTAATFQQGSDMVAAGATTTKLSYSISDVDTAFVSGGLNKAVNITVTGTTGLSTTDAQTVMSATNTGTTVIAKVVGSATNLAALTKGSNDTITSAVLTSATTATVDQATKIAALAGSATYSIVDSAANLAKAAASILNGAVKNGNTYSIEANTEATVAQAVIIDAATPPAAETKFDITDTAAAILAATTDLLKLDSNRVINVSGTVTAAQATALRALDVSLDGTTTFAINQSAGAQGAFAIADTATALLATADATAVSAAASVTVNGTATVANINAINAIHTANTYSLTDTYAQLASNSSVADAATAVIVTNAVNAGQAAIAYSWLGGPTTSVAYNIADTSAKIASVAAQAYLTNATAVSLTTAATVADAGVISELKNVSGGYAITDSAAAVYNALNTVNATNAADRGTLLGAKSITFNTDTTVAQMSGDATHMGLSSLGVSYVLGDSGTNLAAALNGSKVAIVQGASAVYLDTNAGIAVQEYVDLSTKLGTSFKGFDANRSDAIPGIYNISDTAAKIAVADSAVINGANTVVATGSGAINLSMFSKGMTITGNTTADTITGTDGNDIITGGTGADVITGGAGADAFVFAAGANGAAPSATVFDTITDFGTGADTIDFGATSIVQFATVTAAASGTAGVTAAGEVSFDAADNTLALELAAVANALGGAAAGNALVFGFGTDSYIYVTDGTAGVGANDVLIKLTGIAQSGANDTLVIVGGDVTGLM